MNTWKPFFIWNGKTSYGMGVEVLKLPPLIRPAERLETVKIPGRSGTLHLTENAYESYNVSVEIALIKTPWEKISQWLRGSGEIILSTDRNHRQDARIINDVNLEQMLHRIKKGQIQFEVQPYKYEPRQEPVILTAPSTLTNLGGEPAEPVITVYGNGDITFAVNGRSFFLRGITDCIVIDSRMMCASGKNAELMNNRMAGEFPYFDTGRNDISWTGNVTRVEILPYWRWI